MQDRARALLAEGIAALQAGQASLAEARFRRCLAAHPDSVMALQGLAKALHDQLRLDEAEQAFAAAARSDATQQARARYHIGLLHLLQGDHGRGWSGWEHRIEALGHPRLGIPFWDGTPIPGQRLLILGEQGFGDVIQFARFLPEAARRAGTGKEIVFGCAPPLLPLLAPLCEASGIRAVTGSVTPQGFDRVAWLCSLPSLLGATAAETFAASIPYLAPGAERRAAWRRRRPAGALCVGLCWEGRASHPQDAQRSLPPGILQPLAGLPGVVLVGLQRPPLRHALAEPLLDMDWGPDITDFAELAAMVSALDLVVTVDTALAHLAGAMGHPGLVLLPRVPDWRWGLGAENPPWYPSLRLLRQAQAGDWAEVVASAKAALTLAADRRTRSA